jgi:hypothetical protein
MTQVGAPIFWTEITLRRHVHAPATAAAIENRDDQGDSWMNPTLAKIFAGQIQSTWITPRWTCSSEACSVGGIGVPPLLAQSRVAPFPHERTNQPRSPFVISTIPFLAIFYSKSQFSRLTGLGVYQSLVLRRASLLLQWHHIRRGAAESFASRR